MKKNILTTLFVVLFTMTGFAQSGAYWTLQNETGKKIIKDKAVLRESFPKSYKLFDLNINLLSTNLFSIVGKNPTKHSTIISLPNADGGIEEFEIFEASNFESVLQDQFPQIRSFSGRGLTDKSATLKMSFSPKGVQCMIFRTESENEFIEPYSADHAVYASFISNRKKGALPWRCLTDEKEIFSDIKNNVSGRITSSTGELKVMRLAQSCTGEYANFFGASTAGTSADQVIVLSAINATLTRCNGVYEKDLALHLNLVANSTTVFYYDPSTDPYATVTNPLSPPATWNTALQNTLTANIGESNYDVGHLFGASGGGGNAGCIGCVCVDGQKGSGITSPATGSVNPSATFPPSGDGFDIDYVVHEIGHQLGATHSFTFQSEGGPISTSSQKEVASGITIMGYAGITNQDVALHSIDTYHETSIEQIQNNLATKTCPITTNISATNATPVVAAVANRTIPMSTPFILTGAATDANAGDVLTYQWEQTDASTSLTGNASVASPTKTGGPNWLSFSPTTNPTRTCPKLSTILAGLFVTPTLPGGDAIANIEALSSVPRTLNFRLTVRDNSPYSSTPPLKVGQTAFTDMVVTVDGTSGPFMVTSPNTAVSYFANSAQTITWSVNNTTVPPVSCAMVNILISTDGGNTFSMLLANTPNDGSEGVTMPATLTTTARIKVESVGNIFFDISNTNFTITTPPNDFAFVTMSATGVGCPAPASQTFAINTTATGGFSTPINLTSSGLPAGTSVTFAATPIAPGSNTTFTLNNANTLPFGSYTFTITGTAGTTVHSTTYTYNIAAAAAPVITTNSASTSACMPATATFTVASSTAGVTYQWQMAPAATPTVFANIGGATSASFTTAATTLAMSGNVYHCIISTQCATITSANAILTINTAAAITTQPTNQTACTGATATFTTAASGTGVTYQWQSATAFGGPWTNVGTNSASYTTAPLTVITSPFYRLVATTTTCPASVTSNTVTLGVSVTTAIGTQPAAQAVCAGSAATYTVAAVGTGVSYQWQSGTSATGPWTNVGTNSNTFTTAVTTAAMSGTYYQVIVTGSCNAVTSSAALLTVNTTAAITTQPSAVTLCNGVAATFTAAGSGTGVTYQWQSAPSATGPWANVTGGTGANTTSYTTPVTTPAMSGTYYRLVATTTTCALVVNSNAVLLTVNTVAVIGTQPIAVTACIPNTASFSVAATGTGLGYQWQVSINGGASFTDISGATNATYTTGAAVIGMNNNQYRVLVTSTCSVAGTMSNAALLTVINPVTVSQNPVAQSGCIGDNYTFNVTAAPATVSYQWEYSANNGTSYFPISGATTASYTVANAASFNNGYLYRVVVTGTPCGIIITPGAKLTLSYKPTVVLTAAATSNTNPAVNAALTTTVSPVGNYTYNWKKNGTTIANTLATTSIVLPVDDNNTYTVTVTDPSTGCTSAVSSIITTAATSDNLFTNKVFAYPNPVSNVLHVRYNTSSLSNRGTMVSVYDEKGARVFSKEFTIVNTTGNMDINMSNFALGNYMIYVMDANGKKLASTKVVKVQ